MKFRETIELVAPYSLAECQERLLQAHEKRKFSTSHFKVRTDVRLIPHTEYRIEANIRRIHSDTSFIDQPWAILHGFLEEESETTTRFIGEAYASWRVPILWGLAVIGIFGSAIYTFVSENRTPYAPALITTIGIIVAGFVFLGMFEHEQKNELLWLIKRTLK
jgi:hypothetical protein